MEPGQEGSPPAPRSPGHVSILAPARESGMVPAGCERQGPQARQHTKIVPPCPSGAGMGMAAMAGEEGAFFVKTAPSSPVPPPTPKKLCSGRYDGSPSLSAGQGHRGMAMGGWEMSEGLWRVALFSMSSCRDVRDRAGVERTSLSLVRKGFCGGDGQGAGRAAASGPGMCSGAVFYALSMMTAWTGARGVPISGRKGRERG